MPTAEKETALGTDAHELSNPSRQRSDDRWQRRLLPVMVRMVVGLTVFFFIATLAQLYYLHRAIQTAPRMDTSQLIPTPDALGKTGMSAEFRARVLMEANFLERRYHQANVFLMSRVWVHYLGFVTGMILALVGAVFILGKLQTEASQLGGSAGGNSIDFRSTSPGLVLAVLGVILMGTTIVSHHPIETANASIYMRTALEKPTEPTADFAPKP
jgi:hypothetical protein